MQRARFQYSPLGNLLNKKLKVSGGDDDNNKKDDKKSIAQNLIDATAQSDDKMDDKIDDEKEDKSDVEDLIDQYEPDKEDLSKLDELLNGLKDNEAFLNDFKTNMDNANNKQANKDKQEKLKVMELIEDLRDDLKKEMKYTEFLKQIDRKAIDLINQLKSERDELKDSQTKNLDTLNKLKEGLINLPKPVFTPTP